MQWLRNNINAALLKNGHKSRGSGALMRFLKTESVWARKRTASSPETFGPYHMHVHSSHLYMESVDAGAYAGACISSESGGEFTWVTRLPCNKQLSIY
jgi:hypothetical protein